MIVAKRRVPVRRVKTVIENVPRHEHVGSRTMQMREGLRYSRVPQTLSQCSEETDG